MTHVTIDERLGDITNELLDSGITLEQAREAIVKKLCATAMRKTGGRVARAAQMLGIHRNTLLKLFPSPRALRERERAARRRR